MLDGEVADEGPILREGDLTVLFGSRGDGRSELTGLEAYGEDQGEGVFG